MARTQTLGQLSDELLSSLDTTTRTVRGIPTEVGLDQEDGMPQACALSLDDVTLIRPSRRTERITHLGPARMEQVCRAPRPRHPLSHRRPAVGDRARVIRRGREGP